MCGGQPGAVDAFPGGGRAVVFADLFAAAVIEPGIGADKTPFKLAGHVFLGAGRAQVHAVNQAVEHMGEVEFAVDQLVAHAGPAGFLGRDDLDAVFLVNAQHRGHDHGGAVGQRNEANLDLFFLRCVRALGVDGGAQRRVDAHGTYGGGLQHGAACQ